MKCVKINFTDSIDNFFFEDDFMCDDDSEMEYYEDITLPDNSWDDVMDTSVDNEENTLWTQKKYVR
jgi:hypothetical protein